MITLRGRRIVLQPLSLKEIGEVRESLIAVAACNPPESMYAPAMLPHVLKIIAAGTRRFIPDVTLDEVADAVDLTNIGEIQLALIGHSLSQTHGAIGHV